MSSKKTNIGCRCRPIIVLIVVLLLFNACFSGRATSGSSDERSETAVQNEQPVAEQDPDAISLQDDNCDDVEASGNDAGEEDGERPFAASASSAAGRDTTYDSVVAAAETVKEQYPGISWSSQWEELSNMGYSREEIAWAIGD